MVLRGGSAWYPMSHFYSAYPNVIIVALDWTYCLGRSQRGEPDLILYHQCLSMQTAVLYIYVTKASQHWSPAVVVRAYNNRSRTPKFELCAVSEQRNTKLHGEDKSTYSAKALPGLETTMMKRIDVQVVPVRLRILDLICLGGTTWTTPVYYSHERWDPSLKSCTITRILWRDLV